MIERGDRIACKDGSTHVVPYTPTSFVDRWSAVIGHEIQRVRKAVPSIDLGELLGGLPGIVAAMLDDPVVQRTPNISTAMAAQLGYGAIQKRATDLLRAKITTELTIELTLFEALNGVHDYPNNTHQQSQEEYEETADAVVEGVLERYADVTSVSFRGEFSTDTGVWTGEGALSKIARAFANDAWQSLTWFFPARDGEPGRPETPTETMDRLGCTEAVIRASLDAKPTHQPPRPVVTVSMDDFLRRARHAFGSMDHATRRFHFEQCLEGMMDSNDILAGRDSKLMFDGTMEDVAFVRAYGREHGAQNGVAQLLEIIDSDDDGDTDGPYEMHNPSQGEPGYRQSVTETPVASDDDWMNDFNIAPGAVNVVANATSENCPPGPVEFDWMADLTSPAANAHAAFIPTPEKPKRGRKPKEEAGAPPPVGRDAIGPDVLAEIKTKTRANDSELGDLMGCSRATWNNYVKGKGVFVPSQKQRDDLRQFIADRLAELQTIEGIV